MHLHRNLRIKINDLRMEINSLLYMAVEARDTQLLESLDSTAVVFEEELNHVYDQFRSVDSFLVFHLECLLGFLSLVRPFGRSSW